MDEIALHELKELFVNWRSIDDENDENIWTQKIASLMSFSYLNSNVFQKVMSSIGSLLHSCPLQPNNAIEFPQTVDLDADQHFPNTSEMFIESAAYFILDPMHRISAVDGLTISSWINLRDMESNSRFHVCSIGTTKLFATMHVHPRKNYVMARVFYQDKLVGTIKWVNAFRIPNKWVNFVFGLCISDCRIKMMFMFDSRLRTASYVCQEYRIDQTSFAVSFGCVAKEEKPLVVYDLTSVFGFKDSAILLRSMGCARDSLTNCALKTSDYSFLDCLTKALFRSKTELHKLFENPAVVVDKVQRSLLFSINGFNFHSYGLSVVQRGADIEKLQGAKETLLFTLTQEIQINTRCAMTSHTPNRLDQALQTIGYVKLFIFAYALSVDRAYDAMAQFEALQTLISALKRDPMAHRVFLEMDGPVLIARILGSKSAQITDEIFALLMNCVFSNLESESNGKIAISSCTAIVEPALLSTLASSSWLWKNERFRFWPQFITLIGDSIQKPCVLKQIKKFNLHQLEMIHFLTTLLNVLLEIRVSIDCFANELLGNEENATLKLAKTLNSIVRTLLGAPLNLNQFTAFWHYLQLSHPPADIMIDRQISGRLDWIHPGSIPTNSEAVQFETSELSEFFNQLSDKHPKEKICEKMQQTNSIIAVRDEFVGTPKCRKNSTPRKKSTTTFEQKDVAEEIGLFDGDEIVSRYDLPDDIPPHEHWLVHSRAMFLELMAEIVWTCEDSAMAVIQLDVICWNSILVLLTNQKYLRIRSLIVSLLKNFLLRCEEKYQNSFALQHGFVFLSNEIRKHQLDALTVDALFSMTCGEPVTIFHGLDNQHLHSIVYDKFKILSLYALFTSLEQSVDDSLMFWSICSTLQKMFSGDNAPRLAFFEMGLTNSMIKVLNTMCSRKDGVLGYCEDFVWLCLIADHQKSNERKVRTSSTNSEGNSSTETDSSIFSPQLPLTVAPSTALRRMLCHLLFAWIDSIRSVVGDPLSLTNNIYGHSYGRTRDSSEFELLYGESEWSYESINRMLNDFQFTNWFAGLDRRKGGEQAKKQQRDFASVEELSERLLFAFERTNSVFIFLRPSNKVSDEEESLFDLHLELLHSSWKSKYNMKSDEWTYILVACKNRAVSLLGALVAFVMYPARQKIMIKQKDMQMSAVDQSWALIRRLRLAQLLASELPLNRLSLVGLVETNLDYQYALKVAIHELAFLFTKQEEVVVSEFDDDLEKLGRFLKSIQINSPLAILTPMEIASLAKDEELLVQLYQEKELEFHRYLQAKAAAIQSGEHAFLSVIADKATRLTCELAEIQSPWRRKLLQWKKGMESALAKTSETISHLMRELCHPQAVFYDHRTWPCGFALDTTENVKRERRRLKPSYYNFPAKFLRGSNRLTDVDEGTCPLGNLLEGSLSRSALERVEANSQIRRSLSVTLIRTAFECSGEMVMSDSKLFFLGDIAKSTQHRRMLLDHLISLSYAGLFVDREAQLQTAQKMWRKGHITNFDYLMILNKLAGRSFNDLMQYPVFPFILANYKSDFLDFTSTQTFRDLSRPMAIQDRSMEPTYVRMYNSLVEECSRSSSEHGGFPSVHMGAYHYGSHYSNTGIVAYFMVRVLPYTNVALEYQDNNFDIPDRLFNSIQNTWRLSSSESTTDFKELIPEFFFFPEMFENRERLELGFRQQGQQVDGVNLPPWVPDGNARLFCLIHRQALESTVVTVGLPEWIDLIFGYKQQGEAAARAVNLFHPSTYRGRDLESEGSGDELYVNAVRTMIRTYGQMPLQLFAAPHLPHFTASRSSLHQVQNQLLPSVRGIRWGDFVGSPDTDDRLSTAPTCVFQLEENEKIDYLTALNHDGGVVCYGMLDSTTLIVKYKSDREDALRRNFELALTAAISWRFPDRILRIKLIQIDDSLWVNLLDLRSLTVTKIAFSPSNDTLYIGFTNGLIRVYTLTYRPETSELFAHKSTISSLNISDNFHVLLSTSLDSNICLWDTNRLEFVRRLEPTQPVKPVDEVVTLSCISSISCEIALVFESEIGSRVSLYTVNGDVIGNHREDQKITSIAMTGIDEGTGVNCIFLGLERSGIRVLEMWTLSTIRLISGPDFYQSPVVREQDEDLENISGSLHTLKNMSHQIGNELQDQSDLLDDLESTMHRTENRMDGRFGNQFETFLGTLNFAKELNRTLVLPPFLEYPFGSTVANIVAFKSVFDVEPILEFHRVVTMDEFMKTLANEIWPEKERKVLCWAPRESYKTENSGKSCHAKEGNPYGPFWNHFSVDFVDDLYFGQIGYDVSNPQVVRQWKAKYPSTSFPVLAFSSAPVDFPILPNNRHIQRYFRWSKHIRDEAEEFVKLHLRRPFIGIHLRNGENACKHIDSYEHFFASAQCTGDDFEFGRPSKELCFPSQDQVIEDIGEEIRRHDAKSVYVSSDNDFMLGTFHQSFNKTIGFRKLRNDNPYLSLAILDLADHLIANCVSTFSGFAVRQRRFGLNQQYRSHSFFGFRETPVKKIEAKVDVKETTLRDEL
ncbi:Lysosomal-trafficking regulator [Aphelenchoides besseyi]|nr:Lysosomal-trafficking regulator [Aphelenchoides besseyi]